MKLLSWTILLVVCLLCKEMFLVKGDVGTAASYGPPYTPKQCSEEFPAGNMFAAASVALWDNGAACGRRYRLRCLSGPNRPCKGGSIDVEVVDACKSRPCPATLLLSDDAFAAVSSIPDAKINIEYIQI